MQPTTNSHKELESKKDTRDDIGQPDLSTQVSPHISPKNISPKKSDRKEKLLGRFQLQAELGRGAFGVVYRAVDPQLERTVALKLPNFSEVVSERQAARFLREARAAANLHHPNIVAVYDAGCIDSQHYIASAFIDGSTLRHVIRKHGKPSPTSAAKMVAKLADALGYAHRAGVIHRDVKPENILIDSQGTPFIADFGLARFETSDNLQTREGTLLGTPAYMSPEQAQGKSSTIDGRADIWSLGVILYELLAGERPFQGNEIQTLYAVIHAEPPTLNTKEMALSIDLITIVEKCLRKEVSGRYSAAEDLRDDLQNWLNDHPITARKSSTFEKLARWRRRNPTIALMSLVLLLAISIGTSAVTWQWFRAERMRERSEVNERESKRQQKLAEQRAEELVERNLIIDQKNAELVREKSALQEAKDAIDDQLKQLTDKDMQLASTDKERSMAEQLASKESDLRLREVQKNSKLRYLGEVYSASLALQARDLSSCTQFLQATQPSERSLEFEILNHQLKRLSLYERSLDVIKLPSTERDFFLSSHTPIGISANNFTSLLNSRSVSDVSIDGAAILCMQPSSDWFRTFLPSTVDLRQGTRNHVQFVKLPQISICKVGNFSTAAINAWISPDGASLFVLVPRVEVQNANPTIVVCEVVVDFKIVKLKELSEQVLGSYSVGNFTVSNSSSLVVNTASNYARVASFSEDSSQFAICSPYDRTLETWVRQGSDYTSFKKLQLDYVISTHPQSRPLVYLQRGLAITHSAGVDILDTATLESMASTEFSKAVEPAVEVQFSSSKQCILCLDHVKQSYVIQSIDGGRALASGMLPPVENQSLILNEQSLQRISSITRPIVDWNSCRFEQAPDNGWFCIRMPGQNARILVQRRAATIKSQVTVLPIEIDKRANRLVVSKDGEWCATWVDQELTVSQLSNPERRPISIHAPHGPILDAVFSLKKSEIVIVAGNHLTTVNLADSELRDILSSPDLQRVSPIENSDLVVVSDARGTVQIRDLNSGSNRSLRVQRSGAPRVVIDSQSHWMVSGGADLALSRWNFLTNSQAGLVRVESPVSELRLFETQQLLACKLTDESVLLLRWPKLERICRLPAQSTATLDYCPTADGKRILLASAGKVAVFDVATSMELLTVTLFPENVVDAKFLGDGRRVVTLQKPGVLASHQLYE